MFYFQHLLDFALAGIDRTDLIGIMAGIAYAILLIGFLLSMYQAALQGGDVRSLATAAIKYVIIAIIVANWSTVFHELNNAFTSLAQKISNSGGVVDMFTSWGEQLQQQFQNNPNLSLWDLVTGDISGLVVTVLLIVAYIVFALAMVIFSFFYAMYGSALYVLGPPVLSLLPVTGARDLAKSYAQNVMIWNAWALLYAIFGVLITAIHMDRIDQVLGNGFLGWMKGLADAPLLGLISIVYALCIALIPLIAKRLVSGDVGSTVAAIVGTATAAIGVAVAGASGIAAGAGAGAGGSSAAGSASGASSAAGTSAGTSASATAPTAPTRAMTVGEALQSGSSGSSSQRPPAPTPGSSDGQSAEGSRSSQSVRGSRSGQGFYRPVGVMQSLSFSVGRSIGKAVSPRESEPQEANEA